jgi:uncharacterized membrane protein
VYYLSIARKRNGEKVKIFGHPVHPMLVVFPFGLLATSFIFDILYLIIRNLVFPTVSYYMIAAGVLGGLAAALFGFLDWLGLDKGTRARSIGAVHGLGNFVIVVLFAISWLLRRPDPNFVPGTFAFLLSLLGVALALVTGWLGGELVYRMGVSVEPGANENAPSSLSGKPASSTGSRRSTNR